MTLPELHDAVASERWSDALRISLELWRRTRSDAVARIVVELGRRAAKGRSVPSGKRVKDVLAAWVERARAGDAADLDVLLPTLGAGKSGDALARLSALADGHAGDPRIGRALVSLLERPPFQAQSTQAFWKALGQALPAHADEHVAGRLGALEGKFVGVLGGAETMAAMLEKIAHAARDALLKLGRDPLSDAETESVESVARTLAQSAPDPVSEALAGLDRIDWAALEDAYGTAEGVPEQLRAIASSDGDARSTALESAYGNLCHQGSVYPASAAAAPFLVRLSALPEQGHLAELLVLLADLGFNAPDQYAVSGAADRKRDVASAEATDARETWRAVADGVDGYRARLESADPRVRRAASLLLALLVDGAPASVKALARAVAAEQDPDALAMELLALGLLGRARGAKGDVPTFRRHLSHASILVRAAAAIGVACELGSDIDAKSLAVLRAAGETPAVEWDRWLFFGGDVGRHARLVEAGLDLQSEDELLDDLEQELESDALRQRKLERATQLLRRFFTGRPSTPKPTFDELSGNEQRLIVVAARLGIEGLDAIGFFYPREAMRRYAGLEARGPVDTAVDVQTAAGRRSLPIWKILSDALHAHLPVEAAVNALANAPRELAVAVLEELVQPTPPYHLWRGQGHPDDVGGEYDRHRQHNERFVDLRARIAVALEADGETIARRIAEEQLAIDGARRYRSGLHCTFAALALARFAALRGQVLDPRYDVLVAEGITTPPAQRAPRLTEEILAHLPMERAAAISLAGVSVYRLGSNTMGSTTWETIFFDDSLRFLTPSLPAAARVIEAIEAWARIRAQLPKGERCTPLPQVDFVDFLARVGAPAVPLLKASRAKGHAGSDVIDAALDRLSS